jgi:hypothetical protein
MKRNYTKNESETFDDLVSILRQSPTYEQAKDRIIKFIGKSVADEWFPKGDNEAGFRKRWEREQAIIASPLYKALNEEN